MNDPIIKELRKIRHNMEKKVSDSKDYYKYILEVQKKYEERLVCRKPKPALVSKKNSA